MTEPCQAPLSCWYYSVEDLKAPDRFSAGMALLPWEYRREKVMQYRFEKDRLLSLGAGLLAAYALGQYGLQDLTLDCSSTGKPSLRYGNGLHFNLSHSGKYVVCAVSHFPVGVDVEQVKPLNAAVVQRCLTAQEQCWLTQQEDWNRAFTRLWTRKESYLKCLGLGLGLPPNSFSVNPDGSSANGHFFREREVEGHWICICSPQEMDAEFHFVRAMPMMDG